MNQGKSLRGKQSENIRRMVITAMLSAITALLAFTPIGMIPLPPPLLSVTTVHIPVILAAVVEGPWVGLAVGAVFGVCSFARAWESGAVGLTLFMRNPIISIGARLMIPLVTYAVYLLWKRFVKQNAVTDKLGAAVAAVLGSLTNTVLVLGSIVLIYGAELTTLINNMISAGSAEAAYLDNAGAWLVAVVGVPNGLAEALVAAVLIPMIKAALDAMTHRRKRPAKKSA